MSLMTLEEWLALWVSIRGTPDGAFDHLVWGPEIEFDHPCWNPYRNLKPQSERDKDRANKPKETP